MVSIPEVITDYSPVEVCTSGITKKLSSRKPLGQNDELCYIKQKTSVLGLIYDKKKHKTIMKSTLLCYNN